MSLLNIATDYQLTLIKQNKIIKLLQKELTIYHNNFTYVPIILPFHCESIISNILKNDLEKIKLRYRGTSNKGKNSIEISCPLLTSENVDKTLEELYGL